jgi:hypothetical protein
LSSFTKPPTPLPLKKTITLPYQLPNFESMYELVFRLYFWSIQDRAPVLPWLVYNNGDVVDYVDTGNDYTMYHRRYRCQLQRHARGGPKKHEVIREIK